MYDKRTIMGSVLISSPVSLLIMHCLQVLINDSIHSRFQCVRAFVCVRACLKVKQSLVVGAPVLNQTSLTFKKYPIQRHGLIFFNKNFPHIHISRFSQY